MNNIQEILNKKKIAVSENNRKINTGYEIAKEISEYTDINVFIIRRMIKTYGEGNVRHLASFLKDYPNLDKKRAVGLAYWYLKNRKNT